MHQHGSNFGTGAFPREVEGLPAAEPTPDVVLEHDDTFQLRIAPVAKRIGDQVVRMLGYNGSIPGPTLRVRQGTEIVVEVTNDGDVDATVHWHGLRLENRFDGVPHDTQKPIPVGGRFTYRVRFPDEGLYWYHPHIREDYTQDMGLYANIVVEPNDPAYWPPVDRDVVVVVDDVSIGDGRIEAYDRSGPDHVAMGRFGNVLLASGETDLRVDVRRDEVVRLYLTNTANTRVFALRIPEATMKLVGGDSGRVEREELVDEVVIAPSERVVVDVLFDRPGEVTLEHRTPERVYRVATFAVADDPVNGGAAASFHILRRAPELEEERRRTREDLHRAPDRVLALVAEMDVGDEGSDDGRYACPMHPHVVRDGPDRCPECGMKLLPIAGVPGALERTHAGHDAAASGAGHGAHATAHESGEIEWEDTMLELNRSTTAENMRWMLVDRQTGKRNAEIDWSFTVGDRVKIRIVNEMDSDHPMHHPIHFHGAGRFLVLSRDGAEEPSLVWKDTVLVRTGEVVDILLDVSNPGLWMAHCHIAEHTESGMMFSFNVARAGNVEPEARPDRSEEAPMAMVVDPVCGMRIDSEEAAASLEHEGRMVYFCSEACRDAFVADPSSYA